jgi:hypothetical protein
VQSDQVFSELRDREPYLQLRISFAEAVHYLADVPYRYAYGRNLTGALSTLLLGTWFLEDVLDRLEDGDTI